MRNQKGITLIALIITIIVMLILAGVSISMVAGENGVLTRAESAVEKSRAGEIEEALRLAVTENQMMKYAGQTPLTQAQILARLQTEGKLTAEEVAEVTENGKLTIGTTEVDFSILEGNESGSGDETQQPENNGNIYTVTFCDYDGSVLKTVEVAQGGTASYGDTNPEKEGEFKGTYFYQYTFIGWSTELESTETDAVLTNVQSDFSVYARYSYTSACFIAGTKILTDKGLINIEDIQIGMNVYSKNMNTSQIELKEVTNTMRYEVRKDMVKVLVNGELIESTWEHPYYVKGKGWTKAGFLNKNDVLITVNGEEIQIENIEIIRNNDNIIEVYNFEVKDNHNYFVGENNILVHNKQFTDEGGEPGESGII